MGRPSNGWPKILVVVLLLGTSACWAESVVVPGYFQALVALSEGRFSDGVKSYYKVLLQMQPFLLTEDLRRRDLDPALQHFSQGIEASSPASDLSHLYLALIERLFEQWDGAQARLTYLTGKAPQSAVLRFLQGELLLARGDVAGAQQAFRELTQLPNPRKFGVLAVLLWKRRGLSTEPSPRERYDFLLELAYHAWDHQDTGKTEALLRRCIDEFPTEAEAPRALVDLFLQQQQAAAAEEILEAWRTRSSAALLPPLVEARVLYARERFAEAAATLRRVLVAEPDNRYAQMLLAESLYQDQDYVGVAPLLRDLCQADPLNVGLTQRLAECLVCTGAVEEAIKLYEAWIERSPDDSFPQMELAELLYRLDRLEEAINRVEWVAQIPGPLQEVAEARLAEFLQIQQLQLARSSVPAGAADDHSAAVAVAPAASASKPATTGESEEAKLQRVLAKLREMSRP